MQSAAKQAASFYMNDNKRKKIIQLILPAAFVAFFAMLSLIGVYKCPLDAFLGIPCPTCGLTRAVTAALHGDMAMAFYYHPLWPVIPVAVLLLILYHCDVIHPSARVFRNACIFLAVIVGVCFFIRHLQHSPVVMIHFETSVLYRLYEILTFD